MLLFDFAIANNLSELNNEVNHFCLPIFVKKDNFNGRVDSV
ncbi:hypothetical protein APA_3378 [Pseudanabaena sp. lw0831]|nr:hypothetical protein APA_3378 [Pseudanabaena sp. lw0831]